MQFIEKSVTLSKGQVHKLAKGKKVCLPYAALNDGPQKIYVTPQQLRKIETRLKKGVGADIGPFDSSQINHNVQHGAGLWDSIDDAGRYVWDNAIKPGAKIVYEEVAKPLFEEAKKEGVKYLVNEGKNGMKTYFKTGEGMRRAGVKGGKGILQDIGKIFGLGAKPGLKRVRKPRAMKGVKGAGFWDDIGDAFTSVYDNVLKPAGEVVAPIAKEVGKELWNNKDVLIPIAIEMAKAGATGGAGMKRPRGRPRKSTGGIIGYTPRRLGLGVRKQSGASLRLP